MIRNLQFNFHNLIFGWGYVQPGVHAGHFVPHELLIIGTSNYFNLYPIVKFIVKVFTVTSPPFPVFSIVQSATFVKSK